MSYVVVAEFRTLDGQGDAFAALMRRHAEASRAEPGCRLFEVARDAADPALFLLYETYDDHAAYAAHRATAHYARFLAESPAMLKPRDGALFQRRNVLQRV
jgi:quinol monooxygenase YgiN